MRLKPRPSEITCGYLLRRLAFRPPDFCGVRVLREDFPAALEVPELAFPPRTPPALGALVYVPVTSNMMRTLRGVPSADIGVKWTFNFLRDL